MTGKVNFADLANEFIKQLVRMQAQAAVSGIFSGISSMVGGWFGKSSNSSTTSSSVEEVYIPDAMSVAPLHHDGGLAGYGSSVSRSVSADMFRNAPKFHTGGGLMPDEYPAILQKGEYVLNQSDTKAYLAGRMATGAQTYNATSQQEIVINFYDSEGNKQSQKTKGDGKSNMNIDVVLGELDKGLAKLVTQGKSQTAKALDSTRGLNSARALYN